MSYKISEGKLFDNCLWQKKLGYNAYGECEHDYGVTIRCRRNESSKLVRGKNNRQIITNMSYLVNTSVCVGDLLDGCPVLAVSVGRSVYGVEGSIEAHT